ncbi:hypothetical protein KAH55_13710 [bacterium]|nr:hypothetical protein [bacterium]
MRKIFITSIVLAAILMACASTVAMQQIQNDPGRYQNEEVVVRGRVTKIFADRLITKRGIVQIGDETSAIWYIPSATIPNIGDKVKITGKVKTGVTIGIKTFGAIIIENPPKK